MRNCRNGEKTIGLSQHCLRQIHTAALQWQQATAGRSRSSSRLQQRAGELQVAGGRPGSAVCLNTATATPVTVVEPLQVILL